jgi:hypothetical protein
VEAGGKVPMLLTVSDKIGVPRVLANVPGKGVFAGFKGMVGGLAKAPSIPEGLPKLTRVSVFR